MKESLIITLLSFVLVHGNFQEAPQISVKVDGVDRNRTSKFAAYLVQPGQLINLNCSFICLDDNRSKCMPLRWEKRKRNGTLASQPVKMTSKTEATRDVNGGYWLVYSSVEFKSSFTQHVLYQCTSRHALMGTAFIDVIEVNGDLNVTLPTKLGNQGIGKREYPKLFVNDTAAPVVIFCNFTTTATTPLVNTVNWFHNKKLLQNDEKTYSMRLSSMKPVHSATLFIQKLEAKSLGRYECSLSVTPGVDTKRVIELIGPPMTVIQEKPSLRVVEDSKVQLTCRFYANPTDNLKVEWFRNNYTTPLVLETDMTIDDEVDENGKLLAKGNVLTFNKIKATAKGMYYCKVSNQLGEDYLGWQVRVKNRYAYLWPLIGIILEVIVVVVIIVVYEVKKNKKRKAKLLAQQNLQFSDEDCQGMPGSPRSKASRAINNDSHATLGVSSYKSWSGITDYQRNKEFTSGWIEGGHMMLAMPRRPSLSIIDSPQVSMPMIWDSSEPNTKRNKLGIATSDPNNPLEQVKRRLKSPTERLTKPSDQSKTPDSQPPDRSPLSGQSKRPNSAQSDRFTSPTRPDRPNSPAKAKSSDFALSDRHMSPAKLEQLAASKRKYQNSTPVDQLKTPAKSKGPNFTLSDRLTPPSNSKRKVNVRHFNTEESASSTPVNTSERQTKRRFNPSPRRNRVIKLRPKKESWPPLASPQRRRLDVVYAYMEPNKIA